MSFDWKKFIELAEILVNQETEEAFRTAVSRSYYGVFGILRNIKGFKKHKGGDVHSKLIESLKKSDKEKEREIGRLLDELRRYRNYADYSEDRKIDKNLAENCIAKANKILNQLSQNETN